MEQKTAGQEIVVPLSPPIQTLPIQEKGGTPVHRAIDSISLPNAQLFDSTTWDALTWPDTPESLYAQRFLEPLIKEGIPPFIDNICGKLYVLKVDSQILPVIATQDNFTNAYICSPYGHYFALGSTAVHLIKNRPLRLAVQYLLPPLGQLAKSCQINSVVYVDHWLFSTDLHPDNLTSAQIAAIMRCLKSRFPQHAILFRSLNPLTTAPLMQLLQEEGFRSIASRQIFISNARDSSLFHTRILKSDLKLWRERPFDVIDETALSPADLPELLRLYNLLYTAKTLDLQPHITLRFIEHLFTSQLFQFKVLKHNGTIKGVAGYIQCGDLLFCPFFGYDKNDPQHAIIYRILCTALLLEAQKRNLRFHQSAGASFYKSIRRAESCLEFMAIYTKHLPYWRRLPWRALELLINTVAPTYMKEY